MSHAQSAGPPLTARRFPPPSTPAPGFPYRLEGKVGEGSMGAVYRAFDPSLERPVAIKVLLDHRLTTERDVRESQLRFLREARSAAAIQHPGAVTIFRVGNVGEVPYIAMEWLEGETLAVRLARGPLPVAEVLDVALQVLDALAAAHAAGVVHRDVKPANLIRLGDGRIKITDFGIARFAQGDALRTETGMMLGTPAYASPEQLRGEEVDPRSDLYSVGTLLFEALAGRLPFLDPTLMGLATKVLRDPPEPLRSLRPDLAPEIEAVILRALAKERARRFQAAAEMAAALREATVSRPASSEPAEDGRLDPEAPSLSPRRPAADRSTLSFLAHDSHPIYRGVSTKLPHAIAHLVASWPATELPSQPLEPLLARLLERPLHAPAFSGGLAIDERLLLLDDGVVVGAIDRRSGRCGDAVAAALEGAAVRPRLHTLPPGLPRRTSAVLAGLLGGASVRQRGLDGSIVNLAALAGKLAAERFDGVLHLRRRGDEGRVVLVDGATVLALFTGEWSGVDLDQGWSKWVGEAQASLDVEEVSARPLDLTWRLRHRELELQCERRSAVAIAGTAGRSASTASRRLGRLARRYAGEVVLTPAEAASGAAWRSDPAACLLEWLLGPGAERLAEAAAAKRWRYFAEWLPLVRRARLHSRLEWSGPASARSFDFATSDESGKLLHLGRRFPLIDPDIFQAALGEVREAKERRRERGDLGGVVFAAPRFPDAVVEAYLGSLDQATHGLAKLQENLTGYAGFVRVGPRRGFHLLLVEEGPAGYTALGL